MRACCFTGHRDISSAEQRRLIPQLTDEIEKQIAKGVTVFHNGGALGFDMLAALCVLGLRNKYSAIKLYIDVPHSGQADRWSEDKRRVYESILERADCVTVLSKNYYSGCMYARNRHMVDQSESVIAYVRHTRGGAYYTVSYAEEQEKEVIYL